LCCDSGAGHLIKPGLFYRAANPHALKGFLAAHSLFHVITNKITVHFTCIYTLHYIYYIHTYYRMYTKACPLRAIKGFSGAILTIYDFG
jgi:hypothetical protein